MQRQPFRSSARRRSLAITPPGGGGTTGTGTPVFRTPTPSGLPWLSGAAVSANGFATADSTALNGTGTAYEQWRGRRFDIINTYADDPNPTSGTQEKQWAISPGFNLYENWQRPIDLAPGGMLNGQTWAQLASGTQDTNWTTTMGHIRDYRTGRGTTYIRPFHEFNGTWYQWTVNPGDEANFIAAWRRWYAIKDNIFPAAKVVFCTNSDSNSGVDIRAAYPGDAYVDVIATDYYNQFNAITDAASWTSMGNAYHSTGGPRGLFRHREFAASHGKPFALPEWSGVANKGDNPYFVQALWDWCNTNAGSGSGQLLYESQFNAPGYSGNFSFFATDSDTVTQPLTAAKYHDLWHP